MQIETRVLARDVPDVFAESLHLSKAFCRQVIAALKVANRIDAARPVAPPVTPRAIARIALALTSTSVRHAVETEKAIGSFRLSTGEGQPTLEDVLADLVEEAAGWRNGSTDFRDGALVIGHTDAFAALDSSTMYRADKTGPKAGLRTLSVISYRAIASVARELLPTERPAT